MKLLVPVSYFKGQPCNEIWSLDINSGERNLVFHQSVPKALSVNGKGLTGLSWLNQHQLVACDFNQVYLINRDDLTVIASLQDKAFNDLHHIAVYEDKVYVCNTGFDSLDRLNAELVLIERLPLVAISDLEKRLKGEYTFSGDYYDSPEQIPLFCRRKVPDTFHINYCVSIQDRMLLTSFKDRVLLDASTGKTVSNKLNSQPHDGFVDGDHLWITTVTGKIYRAAVSLPLQFKQVADVFHQGEYQGWCRGLLIDGDYLFVGVTQIQGKSSRTHWLTLEPEQTKSGIYQLDKRTLQVVSFYDFTSENGSRIFTFIKDR